MSAGPSLRNPVARRSRIFQSRLLTAPESALSASGRGDLPRRPVLLEPHGAARALHLDAIGLVVGVRDDDLVADSGHRLRHDLPHLVGGQHHPGGIASRHVDALLRGIRLAEGQGLGRAVLVLADPQGDAARLVEAVLGGGSAGGHELLGLRGLELVEEVGDHLGIGPVRARLDDPPLPGLVGGDGERLAIHLEVDARHRLPVEGDDGLVAKISGGALDVASRDLRQGHDGGLCALLGVDPRARRALRADHERQRLRPPLDLDADLRGGGVEAELGELGRIRRDLPVDAGGREARDHLVDRTAVTARRDRLEHFPAALDPLETDRVACPLDADRLHVLRLDGPEPTLDGLRLLAGRHEPVGVVVEIRPEPEDEDQQDGDGLPGHGETEG